MLEETIYAWAGEYLSAGTPVQITTYKGHPITQWLSKIFGFDPDVRVCKKAAYKQVYGLEFKEISIIPAMYEQNPPCPGKLSKNPMKRRDGGGLNE